MKKLKTQLKQLQSTHTISESERARLRSSLDEYMALNPVKAESTGRRKAKWLLPVATLNRKMIALALSIVIVLTSSGATYASADALPGERLYKVKELVEDIEETITITDAGRAKLTKKLVRRREAEIKRLEDAGKLDEAHIKIIERRISKHQSKAAALLQRMDTQDPEQAKELKQLLKANTNMMQGVKLKRLNHYFDTVIAEIETEYKNQESLLQELDDDINEINTVINNY